MGAWEARLRQEAGEGFLTVQSPSLHATACPAMPAQFMLQAGT